MARVPEAVRHRDRADVSRSGSMHHALTQHYNVKRRVTGTRRDSSNPRAHRCARSGEARQLIDLNELV
jgi:hypothetical protein